MRPRILLCAPALIAALALALPAAAKDASASAAAKPVDAKADPAAGAAAAADPGMAAWMEYMRPGAAHENLKALAGTWKTSVKSMMDPKAAPTLSAGTSVSTLIMGGRYLKEEARGEFMGQPFEGLGITGFDNLKKKYVGTWIDTLGTGVMVSEGDVDATGKVFTQRSTYDDPMTKTRKTARWVTRVVSPDQKVFEWWDTGADGKEWMMLEITYTRVK